MKVIEKLAKEYADNPANGDSDDCGGPAFADKAFEAGFHKAIEMVTERIQREASFLSTFPGGDKEYYKLMDTIDLIADVGESEEE